MVEMRTALGTSGKRTVFRKLSEFPYLSSYSHRGKFYALDPVAEFGQSRTGRARRAGRGHPATRRGSSVAGKNSGSHRRDPKSDGAPHRERPDQRPEVDAQDHAAASRFRRRSWIGSTYAGTACSLCETTLSFQRGKQCEFILARTLSWLRRAPLPPVVPRSPPASSPGFRRAVPRYAGRAWVKAGGSTPGWPTGAPVRRPS